MFVDSHCHLDFPQFAGDIQSCIERAKACGVEAMQMISTRPNAFHNILAISSQFEELYCSYGVHPCHVHEVNAKILKGHIIASLLDHSKVIGIGETGLDYYHSIEHKDLQKYSFIEHIKAAQTSLLPVIVHCRDAEADTIEVLKTKLANKEFKILIHCFTGGVEFARQCLDLGAYISFSGIVTYKNAASIQDAAKFMPLDRMLIETDSPYLAPTPHRGKTNEPAFVMHVAEAIANLRGVAINKVGEVTTENFFTLFNKAKRK